MTDVVLHDYWRSSAAYRVRIGLNLLGIAHARRPVDLTRDEQTHAAYLRVNPQGLVPALQIDGLTLTQSLAMLEYLEETRHPGWLPAAPAARARVRALAHAVAMDIHPVCNLRVARHATAQSPDLTSERWMRHFIPLGLAGVEAMLAQGPQGPLCHGDTVSLADICLVPQVYNARRWGVDLAAFARVRAIVAHTEALPAFADAHPDRARPPPL